MKTKQKMQGLILLMLVFTFSCKRKDTFQTKECNTTNSAFKQLYTASVTSGSYSDQVTYDSEVHEYTFQLSANAKICSFGYQSQPALASVQYNIQLLDDVGTTLYSGNHLFSSTATSYVSVPDIQLNANRSYTLRRTQTGYAADGETITKTVGRLIRYNGVNPIPFPVTNGQLTILSSNFYQNGGPLPNFGIPFIDFAYHA